MVHKVKKAHQFKVEYIRAFNQAMDLIFSQQKELADHAKRLAKEIKTFRHLLRKVMVANLYGQSLEK